MHVLSEQGSLQIGIFKAHCDELMSLHERISAVCQAVPTQGTIKIWLVEPPTPVTHQLRKEVMLLGLKKLTIDEAFVETTISEPFIEEIGRTH